MTRAHLDDRVDGFWVCVTHRDITEESKERQKRGTPAAGMCLLYSIIMPVYHAGRACCFSRTSYTAQHYHTRVIR